MVLDLPRSARLAAWGGAFLRGGAPAGQVVSAVVRDDEPHHVVGQRAGTLVGLLDDLRLAGVQALRVVLPAPGDLSGLPGPPAFNVDAVEAGEAVVTVGGEPWGITPRVSVFGSVWEPGAMVTWTVAAVRATGGYVQDLADAERALRVALTRATSALADLDVARWRDDAAQRVAAVRDGTLVRDAVPPGTPARAVRVLATAARVRGIVELACEDDGAAVTGSQATARRRALREVDAVARRALAAAVNAVLEPARD